MSCKMVQKSGGNRPKLQQFVRISEQRAARALSALPNESTSVASAKRERKHPVHVGWWYDITPYARAETNHQQHKVNANALVGCLQHSCECAIVANRHTTRRWMRFHAWTTDIALHLFIWIPRLIHGNRPLLLDTRRSAAAARIWKLGRRLRDIGRWPKKLSQVLTLRI
jgi:hypothetical protein